MLCRVCGAEIPADRVAHAADRGAEARYCSRSCKTANQNRRRRPATWRRCAECGQPFVIRNQGRRCSLCVFVEFLERQERAAAGHRRREASRRSFDCARCGARVEIRPGTSHPRRRFCSGDCSRAFHRGTPRWASRQAAASISLRELWERDERICHLCGEIVRLDEATRDHLIPRSKGGSHHPGNLALAHMVCNARRGNRLLRVRFLFGGVTPIEAGLKWFDPEVGLSPDVLIAGTV